MLTQLGCLILGHDDMIVRAPHRLFLRCEHCGRETPGWILRASHVCRVIPVPRKSIGTPPIDVRSGQREGVAA